jgi:hypothetical protein
VHGKRGQQRGTLSPPAGFTCHFFSAAPNSYRGAQQDLKGGSGKIRINLLNCGCQGGETEAARCLPSFRVFHQVFRKFFKSLQENY